MGGDVVFKFVLLRVGGSLDHCFVVHPPFFGEVLQPPSCIFAAGEGVGHRLDAAELLRLRVGGVRPLVAQSGDRIWVEEHPEAFPGLHPVLQERVYDPHRVLAWARILGAIDEPDRLSRGELHGRIHRGEREMDGIALLRRVDQFPDVVLGTHHYSVSRMWRMAGGILTTVVGSPSFTRVADRSEGQSTPPFKKGAPLSVYSSALLPGSPASTRGESSIRFFVFHSGPAPLAHSSHPLRFSFVAWNNPAVDDLPIPVRALLEREIALGFRRAHRGESFRDNFLLDAAILAIVHLGPDHPSGDHRLWRGHFLFPFSWRPIIHPVATPTAQVNVSKPRCE